MGKNERCSTCLGTGAAKDEDGAYAGPCMECRGTGNASGKR